MGKFLKRLLSLTLVGVMFAVMPMSSVSASNNQLCERYGFKVDEDHWKQIGATSELVINTFYREMLVGETVVKLIFSRSRHKDGNNGIDAHMIQAVLRPHNSYDRTKQLNINSTVKTGQLLMDWAPNNENTTQTYTLGFSGDLSFPGEGVSKGFGISGSVSYPKKAMTINDRTRKSIGKFDINYDYKYNYKLWDSKALKNYVTGTSKQNAVMYVSSSLNKYVFVVNIVPEFMCYTTSHGGNVVKKSQTYSIDLKF